MVNLDRIAAESSQSILDRIGTDTKREKLQAKDIERIATNALGVLQEQGLYAFFLYMLSNSGDETKEVELDRNELASCIIIAQLLHLLNREEIECPGAAFADSSWVQESGQINKRENKKELLKFVSDQIASDLHRLLLIRRLFERVLIYTRYGAKAMNSSAEEESL